MSLTKTKQSDRILLPYQPMENKMSIQEKKQELYEYAMERLKEIIEYDDDALEEIRQGEIGDIFHQIFNMDYYIVGYYQASQWLGADTFDCIAEIQEYEDMHFGEKITDLGNAEKVANMYAYVVGYELVEKACTELLGEYVGQLELDCE